MKKINTDQLPNDELEKFRERFADRGEAPLSVLQSFAIVFFFVHIEVFLFTRALLHYVEDSLEWEQILSKGRLRWATWPLCRLYLLPYLGAV